MNAAYASTSEKPLTTADALARLAEWRDPAAWAAILQQHGTGILRVAQRTTGDAALCDDVCQETLLQIRAHAGSFVPPAPPEDAEAAARGWIMRIACRTALKMVRSRERLNVRETRAASTFVPAASAGEVASLREEHEKVRRETLELPESVREPLCLRFFGEMSYGQLGVALGCSEEAAKKRVQRGLEVLRLRFVANGVKLSAAALAAILGNSSASAAEVAVASSSAGATGSMGGTSAASAASTINAQQLAVWQALLQSSGAPSLSGIVTFGGMTVMAKTVFSAAIVALFLISGVQALSINSLRNEAAQARATADQAKGRADALEKKLDEGKEEVAGLQAQLASQQKEAFALGNQLAELKKSNEARPQWPGTLVAGAPAKRFVVGGRNANGQPVPDGGVQEFNIAVPPPTAAGAGQGVTVTVPEIQMLPLPEETKKALKDAGVNVEDVLKNVKDANKFEFAKDVDMPNGGKMSVRVMKNGDGIVTSTAHATLDTQITGPKPAPKPQPGEKPPAPPADPNQNF